MTTIELALHEIEEARKYTLRILGEIDRKDWFRSPVSEEKSHVAWQVGHLAMGQYRLALERIRGARPEDEALISQSFLKLFGKGSIPTEDPSDYPPLDEIVAVFERVHEQVKKGRAEISADGLHAPPAVPHPLLTAKWQVLFYCARHEMLHAGQLGLLRRQLGYPFTY